MNELSEDAYRLRKVYVLAVLEDGVFKNALEVCFALQRDFGLKCKENTVRKELQRLTKQSLLIREKMKRGCRSYHYKISKNGRERLNALRRQRARKSQRSSYLPSCHCSIWP